MAIQNSYTSNPLGQQYREASKTSKKPVEIELDVFQTEERALPPESLVGRVSMRPPSANVEEEPLKDPSKDPLEAKREKHLLQNLQFLFNLETTQKTALNESLGCEKSRAVLVDMMTKFCENRLFSQSVLYTAVAIQDLVLSSFSLPAKHWTLVSWACLMIAFKSEGESREASLRKQIIRIAEINGPKETLFQLESEILQFMDWKVWRATPIHFLTAFSKFPFFGAEDRIRGEVGSKDALNPYIYNYAKFFCDFCQKDYGFVKYTPSLLAASAILCARRALEIAPEWGSVLNHYTTYSEEELKECTDHIWGKYKKVYPDLVGVTST